MENETKPSEHELQSLQPMTPDLGIVIVDYRNTETTVRFIKEEISKISVPYRLVIINNEGDSTSNQRYIEELNATLANTEDIYHQSSSSVFLIPSKENLGFAKGNNLGASFLIDNFNCKYLLFTNNDIIIRDNEVVSRLISKLQADSSIGMIGPEVIGLDGKRQSPEPFIPMSDRYVRMYMMTPFISKKNKVERFKLDYSAKAQEGYHYRIMGSFFLIPSEIFLKIGKMDSNTFLYAEEMILSEKLKKIGKKVYFLPDVTVVHAHGATTRKHLERSKISSIQAKSEKYYYTCYCGLPNWKASIYLLVYKLFQSLKSLKDVI